MKYVLYIVLACFAIGSIAGLVMLLTTPSATPLTAENERFVGRWISPVSWLVIQKNGAGKFESANTKITGPVSISADTVRIQLAFIKEQLRISQDATTGKTILVDGNGYVYQQENTPALSATPSPAVTAPEAAAAEDHMPPPVSETELSGFEAESKVLIEKFQYDVKKLRNAGLSSEAFAAEVGKVEQVFRSDVDALQKRYFPEAQ